MPSAPQNPVGAWPREMRAPTAAAYVDEPNVEAFLRKVGSVYPEPVKTKGVRAKWLKDDLDAVIERRHGKRAVRTVFDAASVL